MHHFQYKNDGQLYCEEVRIDDIALDIGTPFYLYSYRTLERHFRVFESALENLRHLVCFSVKANSNVALLRVFARLGWGMDIVSAGELFRALQAGTNPSTIVFSGVGKREDEIRYALEQEILLFNVESSQELHAIDRIAGDLGAQAPVSLRVNPDIDPETHPYIATGIRQAKFGIGMDQVMSKYKEAHALVNTAVKGISCHIGSQLTQVSPFVDALRRVKDLVRRLRNEGIALEYVDLGGGLGITYQSEEPPSPDEYARALEQETRDLECTFIFEPGRVIVGNAGILVTRVLYTKEGEKNFVIVDAAMNDLIRPALYGAYQQILPVIERGRQEFVADMVGPICETGDFLARERIMPHFASGDLVAIMSAGAYGFSMASNYNSRPRVAEVLVHDDVYHIIRDRETYADLVRGEHIPAFLDT
jgi:diaminopimelate decarboxylase